jgi:hypothetical protein
MVDLGILTSAPIKVVFLIHFVLTAWGAGHWCPVSYLFYNLIFFLILLWTVHNKESDDPTQMAVAVNAVSIVLDVLVIAMYFPDTGNGSERFSAAMAILNLILRPFTTLVLYRIYVERANATGATVPTIFGTQQRSPYEDIGGTVHQTVPTNIPSPSNKGPPPYHA